MLIDKALRGGGTYPAIFNNRRSFRGTLEASIRGGVVVSLLVGGYDQGELLHRRFLIVLLRHEPQPIGISLPPPRFWLPHCTVTLTLTLRGFWVRLMTRPRAWSVR